MGQYKISEAKTGKFEGLYANNPNDTGKETFAGISRKHWPKWAGWPIIDNIKNQLGLLTQSSQNSKAGRAAINTESKKYWQLQTDGGVSEFYKGLFWDVNKLDQINDQQVCDTIYDFGVNSGTDRAAKFAQQSYNDLRPKGAPSIAEDGKVGPKTIAAINSLNPVIFHTDYNARRRDFYRSIATGAQREHLNGWLNRCKVYVI